MVMSAKMGHMTEVKWPICNTPFMVLLSIIVPFSPQETVENRSHVGALELLVAPRVSARVLSGMSKDSK